LDVKEKMERARIQLLLDHPFFGYLGSYLEMDEEEDLEGPIGTDHKKLYFNPDYIKGLEGSKVEACIAHGILHTVLGHQWRRGGRLKETWDCATDLATNWTLTRSGFNIPGESELDTDYEDKSAEEIYSILRLEGENGQETSSEEDSGKIIESGEGTGGGKMDKLEIEDEELIDINSMDDHSSWTEASDDTDIDPEQISEEWKRRVAESSTFAREEGNMPKALERIVEEILEPTLDWRRILRRYILQHAREDYDWMRPDRRLLQYGVYYPSPNTEMLDIAIGVDTSGSIKDEDIEDFLSEMKGILESADTYRARLLACDAELHSEITVSREEGLDVKSLIEDFSESLKGRGGTKYSPVFEALEDDRIQVLIYLTDGRCREEIDRPNFDVIWAITQEGTTEHLDFGKVVRLEGEKVWGGA